MISPSSFTVPNGIFEELIEDAIELLIRSLFQ
jgi:hypothetical protein